jgi:nucleoside-diphosphate-sugar epimerase
MRVFVAGATGALGKRLVPLLGECGFEVAAMTRSPEKERSLREMGAEPVVADGLDRGAVMEAVSRSEPEVVIHQMTVLAGISSVRNFDKEFEQTSARRFIAQSFGNWNYEPTGTGPKTEEDPLDPDPPAKQRQSLAAIRQLEKAVLGAEGIEGIALRYGNFYGPGTGFAEDGEIAPLLRKRRFPIVGDGNGLWSFAQVDDAATATIAAIERGSPGVYNVADDEPARVADWLPELARALSAPPPRRVPLWLGRLATGEVGVSLMTRIRGASNAKAKRELGWRPRYPTYREGFRDGLGGGVPRIAPGPVKP